MKWQNKLAKKELRHLREVGKITTLRSAKNLFAGQVKMREADNRKATHEPCWECKTIASKLGFSV